jgi:hypothetical protein
MKNWSSGTRYNFLITGEDMKGRGLYGQEEGGEHNHNGLAEYMADSDTVEGPELAVARRFAKAKDFQGLGAYIKRLQAQGWKSSRTDSLLTRAMQGIRL